MNERVASGRCGEKCGNLEESHPILRRREEKTFASTRRREISPEAATDGWSELFIVNPPSRNGNEGGRFVLENTIYYHQTRSPKNIGAR